MCSLTNCNLFIFSTNLDDVSYDRLIWKRCNVALEDIGPGDKLLNVIVYLMTVKKIHVWLYVAVLTCIECFLFCIQYIYLKSLLTSVQIGNVSVTYVTIVP